MESFQENIIKKLKEKNKDAFLKGSPYIILNIIENTVNKMDRYNIHIKTHQLMFGENFSKMWSKWLQDSAKFSKDNPCVCPQRISRVGAEPVGTSSEDLYRTERVTVYRQC